MIKIPLDTNKFEKIISVVKDIPGHFYVCGGSVSDIFSETGKDINDIDIFCHSEEDIETVKNYLYKNSVFQTKSRTAFTFIKNNIKIQIILCTIGNIEEIFDNFDINKSMIGIEFNNGVFEYLYKSKNYNEDLFISNINFDTINRIEKYVNKGFNPNEQKIIEFIKNNLFTDIEVFYADKDKENYFVKVYELIFKFIKFNENKSIDYIMKDLLDNIKITSETLEFAKLFRYNFDFSLFTFIGSYLNKEKGFGHSNNIKNRKYFKEMSEKYPYLLV